MSSDPKREEKEDLESKGSSSDKPVKSPNDRSFPWRSIFLSFVFFVATIAVAGIGYFLVPVWEFYFAPLGKQPSNLLEDWEVYKSETYNLGLRYPNTWEVTEVNSALIIFKLKKSDESEDVSQEYVSLVVTSNVSRAKTLCEEDQRKCSFHANGIFGELIITPGVEIIFFSRREDDFTLTLHKYGGTDLAATFGEIGESLRFVVNDQENDNEDDEES